MCTPITDLEAHHVADDLATALASRKLGEDEGKEVWASAIEIPGAAGGLREALAVEPVVLHYDEVVHVVLKCIVRKLRHEPLRDTNALRRVHILEVEAATLIEGDVVSDALATMADKIKRAKEAAEGVQRLPEGDDTGDNTDLGDPDEPADGEAAHLGPVAPGEWDWGRDPEGPPPAAPAADAEVAPVATLGRGRRGKAAGSS